MPTRSESIKTFLAKSTHSDLGNLYSLKMECQVNVAQDGGDRVDEEFQGRRWHGWTDGVSTWKSFRIPYKASTDPEYTDKEMSFDLAAHSEGIGMTGWNWLTRQSIWVAFDFDSVISHGKGLTVEELEEIRAAVTDIPWITIRKSTSGKGIHLYIFLDPVDTENHNEHAALARAILGKLSAQTGYDFNSKVDICGGNMWVWHRKMLGTDGLEILKSGSILKAIPPNWRDHIRVVSGRGRKNLPQNINIEELAGQRPKIDFDDDHRKLIKFLTDGDLLWWWDQDHRMLVTHTTHLKAAHEALQMRGYFNTTSGGVNPDEQNCFAFPLRRGGWVIRRYSPGVTEHESWDQDGAGWTRTYLNREPDLGQAARAYAGVEDPKGGFVFQEAEVAGKAASLLGINLDIPPKYNGRETVLKQHKDGRLIIEIKREPNDTPIPGWLAKDKKPWTRLFNAKMPTETEPDVIDYDDIVRHLVTESKDDYGWMIKTDGHWHTEPLAHIRVALSSLGHAGSDINHILGSSIFKCWKLVNLPFQTEYPGDRQWNRNAAQLRFTATNSEKLSYPTWGKLLTHCGGGLDEEVKVNAWAKANGIVTGADYLKCWIASVFQEPNQPLPYIFLYGPQNSGKSIFHEALSLLLTRGYKRADAALISQSGFNAELEAAIICVVEETDLRKNKMAYNRIKDWVTSRELLIHAKGKTPYHTPNTSHWIQCSNDPNSCPVFTGDTRIVMAYVESLDPLVLIPKKVMIRNLEKEASDFIADIIKLEIPESPDRLNIPVILTEDKAVIQKLNQTPLETFIEENCDFISGYKITFKEFYDRFEQHCDPLEVQYWTKKRIAREIPPNIPKGQWQKDGQIWLGNIIWKGKSPDEPKVGKFVVRNNTLIPVAK